MAVPPPPPPPPRPQGPNRQGAPDRNRMNDRNGDRSRPGRPTGRPEGGTGFPRWVAWFLLAVVVGVVLLSFMVPGDDRKGIAYNDFLGRVDKGEVSSAT